MVENGQIEDAVRCFKSAEKKFIESLSAKAINEEELGGSLNALEEQRGIIKQLLGGHSKLEIDGEETRKTIKEIREDRDLYGKICLKLDGPLEAKDIWHPLKITFPLT